MSEAKQDIEDKVKRLRQYFRIVNGNRRQHEKLNTNPKKLRRYLRIEASKGETDNG